MAEQKVQTAPKERGAVAQFFVNMTNNLGIVGEFLKFLWARKLWWLIPMVVMLLLFGFLLIFANASGIGPFIYTLF
jgi:drug/metabolite transporter superfamily protein YnfA